MPGKKNKRKNFHERLRERSKATAHESIDAALEKSRQRDAEVKAKAEAEASIIKNPVHIYQDGRWQVVDKSAHKFPHPINMTIGWEWALKVLDERNKNNRRIRQDRVNKYTKDIISGNWSVINSGIGFYEDGTLADGQHRLWAVADSQAESLDTIVVFGIKESAMVHIDEGASRTTKDVASMQGIACQTKHLAATNYMLEVKGIKRTMPRGEQLKFFLRHQKAVEFVFEHLSAKIVSRSPIIAACTRAYYHIEHEKLANFLTVMNSGVSPRYIDSIPVALRNFAFNNVHHNTGSFRFEVYRKTINALRNYDEGNIVTRLHAINDDIYPLPEEMVTSS